MAAVLLAKNCNKKPGFMWLQYKGNGECQTIRETVFLWTNVTSFHSDLGFVVLFRLMIAVATARLPLTFFW